MKDARGQLALELPHRPALGREDFLVAPCNAHAVAWIDRWPAWPGPALVLAGPAGCGKTHLAHVWRARTGAVLIEGRDLTDPGSAAEAGDWPSLLGRALRVVVEDADTAAPEPLFHLYNHLAANGGSLLLTARTPPARWGIHLDDLASRLKAAPVAAIGMPDDALTEAVMVKLFADRQIAPPREVITYLLARMERSFEAARRTVAALDRAALERRQSVTVPLARRVLEGEGDGGN